MKYDGGLKVAATATDRMSRVTAATSSNCQVDNGVRWSPQGGSNCSDGDDPQGGFNCDDDDDESQGGSNTTVTRHDGGRKDATTTTPAMRKVVADAPVTILQRWRRDSDNDGGFLSITCPVRISLTSDNSL